MVSLKAISRLGKVLIVGGGRMGQTILDGLVTSCVCPEDLVVANPGQEKRAYITETFGVECVPDAVQALPADTVILAVKPAKVDSVCRSLAEAGFTKGLVVSIAAGVTTASIESIFGEGVQVVRVMPNTPLTCNAGMAGISAGASCGESGLESAMSIFDIMGSAVVVEEELQDAITAMSGSGPAYFELFCKTMVDAGVKLGLSPDIARELAIQTMKGTAVMLEETGQDLDEAIDAVSSPGGTTVAALDTMKGLGVERAIAEGVAAAAKRSAELGA